MLLVVVSVIVGTSAVATGQSTGDAASRATDVGVTPKEIRIAVVADVDNPAAPGLFQGSVDGVKGFAKYINAHGGLAGRQVRVDFIDSRLSADEARNAVIKACSEDFALVGTSALFLNNVDDMVACRDQAGAATGLPDIPIVSFELAQACSPVSFPIVEPLIDCATKDQHPQVYRSEAARAAYYKKQFGDLHGVFVYPADLQSGKNASRATISGMKTEVQADAEFDMATRALQSAYTPVVQKIKDDGSTYVQSGGAQNTTVALRKEAKLQGVTSVKVWDCTFQCYDRHFLEQGGGDVEGQFVSMPFLPWGTGGGSDATRKNAMLRSFVKFTGSDKADGFAAEAWVSGVLLRDAINKIVKQGGKNALTRKALLQTLPTINDFTADGMFQGGDVGRREPGADGTVCQVLLQVKDGKFEQVLPKTLGRFFCKKDAIIRTKLDLLK
jgi:ABC-type branched-subunit amino acid transport system substrate-binding protein